MKRSDLQRPVNDFGYGCNSTGEEFFFAMVERGEKFFAGEN
jgi:hypothetical protein